MELWIPITVAAAFCQNLRSLLQNRIKSELGTFGATATRFVFAGPLALSLLLILSISRGTTLPPLHLEFMAYGALGGLGQILGTVLLLHLFTLRNFAIGNAYIKSETIQTALFGILILGELLSWVAALGILISLGGVILISLPKQLEKTTGGKPPAGWYDTPVFLGLLGGGVFGIAAVAYRASSLSLEHGDTITRAAMTLAFVTCFQALAVLIWMVLRKPGLATRLLGMWRKALPISIVGMLGSLGWFIAFTLENAALVRAVGQVEVLFTIGTSVVIFKERLTRLEIAGIALVTAGILGLVLGS